MRLTIITNSSIISDELCFKYINVTWQQHKTATRKNAFKSNTDLYFEGHSLLFQDDDDSSFYRARRVQTLLHMTSKQFRSQHEFKFMVEIKGN